MFYFFALRRGEDISIALLIAWRPKKLCSSDWDRSRPPARDYLYRNDGAKAFRVCSGRKLSPPISQIRGHSPMLCSVSGGGRAYSATAQKSPTPKSCSGLNFFVCSLQNLNICSCLRIQDDKKHLAKNQEREGGECWSWNDFQEKRLILEVFVLD